MEAGSARQRRLLRLQSSVRRWERQLSAQILRSGLLDLEYGRRRLAVIASLVRSRQTAFAGSALSGFDCFALTTFTGYCAQHAGLWRQRQDEAAKSIALLAPQRAKWARLRKGLERRTPASTRSGSCGSR